MGCLWGSSQMSLMLLFQGPHLGSKARECFKLKDIWEERLKKRRVSLAVNYRVQSHLHAARQRMHWGQTTWGETPACQPPLVSSLLPKVYSQHSGQVTLLSVQNSQVASILGWQSLQWLFRTHHCPKLLSYGPLPSHVHATQSQGPLPSCLSLRLLLPQTLSLAALFIECSVPLSAWAKSVTSFGTRCKCHLLRKISTRHPTPQWALICPSHLLLLPLLLPLLWSNFPTALMSSTLQN